MPAISPEQKLNNQYETILAENKELRIQLLELQIALRRAKEHTVAIEAPHLHLVAANG